MKVKLGGLVNLPEPLEIQFWQEVYQLEEERQVSYITSVERIGFERGRQEGESTLILRLLNRRIGQISANLVETIQQLPIEQLENLGEALLDFSSETDLINWLNSHND